MLKIFGQKIGRKALTVLVIVIALVLFAGLKSRPTASDSRLAGNTTRSSLDSDSDSSMPDQPLNTEKAAEQSEASPVPIVKYDLVEALRAGLYIHLLAQRTDFVPIMRELEPLMAKGVPEAFFLMGKMLEQCRDVRRLMRQTAPEFIAQTNVTDPKIIQFYYDIEAQCRTLFTEGLWDEQYPYPHRLVIQAARDGLPVAMVDRALTSLPYGNFDDDDQRLLIDALNTGEPLAIAFAAIRTAGTVMDESDGLALILFACDQSPDCLESTGIYDDMCETESTCVPGNSFRDNVRLYFGEYELSQAEKRANELAEAFFQDGWSEETFKWRKR